MNKTCSNVISRTLNLSKPDFMLILLFIEALAARLALVTLIMR
jgi:hypothetical protein